MKRDLNERTIFTVLAVSSLTVVLVLAIVLYRWSNQISETTTVRLADSLQMSLVNWHLNLFRDLSDICLALRVDADGPPEFDQYAQRFTKWKSSARYPDLIEHLYVLQQDGTKHPVAFALDASGTRFDSGELPGTLKPLWEGLQQRAAAGAAAQSSDIFETDSRTSDSFYLPGGYLAGWQFASGILALVRPIHAGGDRAGTAWIVVQLNLKSIQQRVLPDLARRYFSGVDGLDYMVAVVAEAEATRVIYSSDPDFATHPVEDADGRMDVFGNLTARQFGSPIHVFHMLSQNAELSKLAASVGSSWFPLIGNPGTAEGWQLIVRHRRGGALGAFVAEMHRRDLAISLGVLLFLVVSITMLIVTSQRAHHLGKMQMGFVTAVSHELRSPLAIISSAAENIAEGFVETPQQMTRYGSVIENQARRLSRLVEEILLFAATREHRHRYSAHELDVANVVDSALKATADLIEASQFTLQVKLDPNLPHIIADGFALSQCLQNLITNALKYGGNGHWIGIRAGVRELDIRDGREIQIAVSDRGIGIEKADLAHIFEPFYRSPSVAAQIHGTGLGLSLAKNIAESMGGHLTVASEPRKGSTFTLHLPCVPEIPGANRSAPAAHHLEQALDRN